MLKIMVVDDNENARKLAVSILKRNNYDTVEAADGQDALDELDKGHVDLIILDVMMPNMDGIEFTKILRSAGWETPILMITL